MLDRRWNKPGVLAVLGMSILGVTACQPPPPVPVLAVNTTVVGPDAAPGNGRCEMNTGQGDCSLQAAVEEGNALGKADITVPAGHHDNNTLTITGNLSINRGAPGVIYLADSTVHVVAGATLAIDGASYGRGLGEIADLTFTIDGVLAANRIQPFSISGPALRVGPGGTANVSDSGATALNFQAWLGVAIENEGTLNLFQSTVHQLYSGAAVVTSGGGATSLTATLVVSEGEGCAGTLPTSSGYNYAPSSCGLSEPTDQSGTDPAGTDVDSPYRYELAKASSLVDAIPLGTLGCSADRTDVSGYARGVDGNEDGTVGCDIGAAELQVASAR